MANPSELIRRAKVIARLKRMQAKAPEQPEKGQIHMPLGGPKVYTALMRSHDRINPRHVKP